MRTEGLATEPMKAPAAGQRREEDPRPDGPFNLAEPLQQISLYEADGALRDAVRFNFPELDQQAMVELGRRLGVRQVFDWARQANTNVPVLRRFDEYGRPLNEVEFHPSYHELMKAAIGAGLNGHAWERDHAEDHFTRAVGFYLFAQMEQSVLCPTSMSYAVVPALRANKAIFEDWKDKLFSRSYDGELRLYSEKAGVTVGMGMTEKQGGSDVRANITSASFDGQDRWGERYRINGHKWFFSAPMCDAFLVLANTDEGSTCFFVPRILPDGSKNGLFLQRLKDKLGNKANASSEVEFHDAIGWLVGESGQGIKQILEMGNRTRLDSALTTNALMRQALIHAMNHARQRSVFGSLLVDKPMMRNVLADLALECEAATALSMRVARAFAHADVDEGEKALVRFITPLAKYWICKRGSIFGQEALEVVGGNGYIEADGYGVLARIYREMPLNAIWEGASNVMVLDLLRVMRRYDVPALLEGEFRDARGFSAILDQHMDQVLDAVRRGLDDEFSARAMARDAAIAVQAALLVRSAPAEIAEAFCESRILARSGDVFGALRTEKGVDILLERAMS